MFVTSNGDGASRVCVFRVLTGESVLAINLNAFQARRPLGIALGGDDECFVCDGFTNRVLVFESGSGDFRRSFGSLDGPPFHPRAPYGVTVGAGRVYVSEARGHGEGRIQCFEQGCEEAGAVAVMEPRRCGRAGALNFLSMGDDGRLLVCDGRSHCIHHVVPLHARMRRWRIVARLAAVLLAMEARAIERLFAPGGSGYQRAEQSFAAAAATSVEVVLDAINRNAIGRVR